MDTFTVKTGFGYFSDSAGNIIAKAELSKGEHPVKTGYKYFEVKSRIEFDKLIVWKHPDLLQESMIRKKMDNILRKQAIEELKQEGKL